MRTALAWAGLAAATSLTFCAPIAAQALTQDGLPILAAEPDGTLIGIADGYKAVFLADGLEYTPVLGRRAPHDMPLQYRLVAAGRGSAMQPVTAARRSHDGRTVRFERNDLVETYEVRGDGVKQSFVFTRLPAGRGDLIVRGALTTELVAGPVTQDGMSFELSGVGAVTIGAVLGYDAAGHRVAGEMRCEGGSIEFSLPASFVDRAVLPVVIDPLVGTTLTLGGANDDNLPHVAFETFSATWLVVWRRDLSATNYDIRGQRIDGSGVTIGGQINIETDTSTLATTPRIAWLQDGYSFIVIWSAGGDIFARGISAITWTLTPEVTVASGSNNQITPDISGDSFLSGANTAFAVWADATAATISLRPITDNANDTLSLGSTTAVTSGWPDSDPSISRSGGKPGVWLVTWTRDLSGNLDIRGRLWDRALGFAAGFFAIENGADDCMQSSCDGDGDNWVVAYARYEVGVLHDVDARSVLRQSNGVTLGTVVTLAGDANDDETAPSACWSGNSALVGYIDLNGAGNYDAYVRSIDPFRCEACEGLFLLGRASHVVVQQLQRHDPMQRDLLGFEHGAHAAAADLAHDAVVAEALPCIRRVVEEPLGQCVTVAVFGIGLFVRQHRFEQVAQVRMLGEKVLGRGGLPPFAEGEEGVHGVAQPLQAALLVVGREVRAARGRTIWIRWHDARRQHTGRGRGRFRSTSSDGARARRTENPRAPRALATAAAARAGSAAAHPHRHANSDGTPPASPSSSARPICAGRGRTSRSAGADRPFATTAAP